MKTVLKHLISEAYSLIERYQKMIDTYIPMSLVKASTTKISHLSTEFKKQVQVLNKLNFDAIVLFQSVNVKDYYLESFKSIISKSFENEDERPAFMKKIALLHQFIKEQEVILLDLE